ncbi:hypothetical protein [Streptomyces cyanogenus]|uniref:Uncharacterized protein n=1 Tax=Streptomyces cyanogenus TaxID=80860 RepID=A0ABX7U036_STRCY|nr:hypothetical protein [Streptomyces cyanogenus]QTE02127.1 hypothetical protein S1361_32650 [Streptomyces cyanogenus]
MCEAAVEAQGAYDEGELSGDLMRAVGKPALGSALTAPAEGRCAAVGSELAVAADRVAADEVTEQEEISRNRCQP